MEGISIEEPKEEEATRTILASKGYIVTDSNSQEIVLHLTAVTGDQVVEGSKPYARIESKALDQRLTFGGEWIFI